MTTEEHRADPLDILWCVPPVTAMVPLGRWDSPKPLESDQRGGRVAERARGLSNPNRGQFDAQHDVHHLTATFTMKMEAGATN